MATAEALLFRDLAYVFAAALLGGVLAHAARQPLILGYVAADAERVRRAVLRHHRHARQSDGGRRQPGPAGDDDRPHRRRQAGDLDSRGPAFPVPAGHGRAVGVGLTQIGEFSFILVPVARASGLVGDDVYSATLASSLVTILINAALVRCVARTV